MRRFFELDPPSFGDERCGVSGEEAALNIDEAVRFSTALPPLEVEVAAPEASATGTVLAHHAHKRFVVAARASIAEP